MHESERRPRFAGGPRMSPEEVAGRAFGTARKGFVEAEVRAFLRRVAEELAAAREREQSLVDTTDELERRLQEPPPLDEKDLLDALGQETARLLRSAKEAADDIRGRAEAKVAQLLEEAQAEARRHRAEASDEARRLREEAEADASRRSEEARASAARIVETSEAEAAATRAEAERFREEQSAGAQAEAEATVEAARGQGREMLEQAKAVRERVLTDLTKRRDILQTQVDELRRGRDALIDAFRVVKRSFLEATDALARAEERAATRSAPGDVAGAGEPVGEPAGASPGDGRAVPEGEAPTPHPETPMADVDSLFARLRAGATTPEATAATVAVTGEEAEGGAGGEGGEEAGGGRGTGAAVGDGEAAPGPEPAEEAAPGEPEPSPEERWLSGRDEVTRPAAAGLARSLKRLVQDEQNALLDAVRRAKGRPVAEKVLPGSDEHLAAWSEAVRSAVESVYAAGRRAAGGEESGDAADLVAATASALLLPLRERLIVAIDEAPDLGPDTATLIAERVGARGREWRSQSVEAGAEDELVAVWARGVYDAAPAEATLAWVPAERGRCADCDDNALEPTAKGSPFPTGQLHPPAHPGCRCLPAPIGALEGAPRDG